MKVYDGYCLLLTATVNGIAQQRDNIFSQISELYMRYLKKHKIYENGQ